MPKQKQIFDLRTTHVTVCYRYITSYNNWPTWPQVSRLICPVVQLNTWMLDGLTNVEQHNNNFAEHL